MENKGKYYITTAIAYASGKPHIGNTYEIIMADAIARYKRMVGYDVFFQPAAGGFIQGKDETVSVSMILAFRHGGPAAYEVLRITEEGQESRGINEEEVAEALEITEVEAAEETAVEDEQNPPSEPVEASQPKAEGPSLKVVGKIELSPLDQYERFKK